MLAACEAPIHFRVKSIASPSLRLGGCHWCFLGCSAGMPDMTKYCHLTHATCSLGWVDQVATDELIIPSRGETKGQQKVPAICWSTDSRVWCSLVRRLSRFPSPSHSHLQSTWNDRQHAECQTAGLVKRRLTNSSIHHCLAPSPAPDFAGASNGQVLFLCPLTSHALQSTDVFRSAHHLDLPSSHQKTSWHSISRTIGLRRTDHDKISRCSTLVHLGRPRVYGFGPGWENAIASTKDQRHGAPQGHSGVRGQRWNAMSIFSFTC